MADIKSGQDVTSLMAGIKSGDDVTALMSADVGSSATVPEPPRGRDFKIFGVNIHVPPEDKPRLDSNIATVGGVGIAPEDALMVGQAAKGIAAATSAGGMVAGLKEAVKTANPVVKFEVSRRALKAVGVPDGVAEVIAFGVSGYRRGGKPPVPEGPTSEPGYPRAGSTPAPPPAPVEPPAHLDLSQRVPAGGLTQQQIAERLAATRSQGMTAPQVEPVMAQRPSPSSVPVPEGPPEPSMAKPAAEPFNPPRVKSPQQTLNEEAIARRRAAYQASQQPAYTKEVVHITTPEAAKGIKDTGFDVNRGQGLGGDKYGPGVYLADKQSDMGGYWRSQLETKNPTGTVPTESMSGDVTLSRPFVYEYNKYGNGAEVVGRISPREALGAKRPDLLQKYDALVKNGSSPNEALGETVRSSGYDGLVVKHRAGDEIVAFDAKSVKFSEPTAKDYDPAAELARILGTPSDAERRFPPNKSGLPSNPPTARKARGKVSDLADMPIEPPKPVGPTAENIASVQEATRKKFSGKIADLTEMLPATQKYAATQAGRAEVLDPEIDYALKWIEQDMESIPYTKRTVIDHPDKGMGGARLGVGGSAGAKIYRNIVGDEGSEISGAKRGDVLKAIKNLREGKVTPVGELVLGVARDLKGMSIEKLQKLMATPPP